MDIPRLDFRSSVRIHPSQVARLSWPFSCTIEIKQFSLAPGACFNGTKQYKEKYLLKPYSTQKEASLAHQGTLTNQTLQRLIGWLKDGKFKPGSKLPSQSELVRQLGISRTGVREALQGMVALNLIEIRPGLGCFVKTTSADSFINENVLGILLEKEAILDLIETRKILEGGIAALAAERADKQALWNMEDVLNRLEQAVKRGESVADVATEFHNALAEATNNAVLVKLLRSFNKLMASAGRLVEAEAPSVEHFRRHELASHRVLYNSIRSRDPARAHKAILRHISGSEHLIIKAFEKAESNNCRSSSTSGRPSDGLPPAVLEPMGQAGHG